MTAILDMLPSTTAAKMDISQISAKPRKSKKDFRPRQPYNRQRKPETLSENLIECQQDNTSDATVDSEDQEINLFAV